MGWDTIFRAGSHTDSQGRTRTYTEADLDRIVGSYDPSKHEAPLTLGHPKDNAPAYGWVESLRRIGKDLQAKFKQVPEELRQAVTAGNYRYKSISLFADGALRHVGILGAAAPAVQGLGPVQFGDGQDFIEYRHEEVDVNEVEQLKKKLDEEKALREAADARAASAESESKRLGAEFSAQQQEQQRKDRAAKFQDLVKAGKALPADEVKVIEFAKTLGGSGQEICFSAAEGKKDLEAHFWDFMASRPQHGLFNEFSAPDQDKAIDIGDLTNHV